MKVNRKNSIREGRIILPRRKLREESQDFNISDLFRDEPTVEKSPEPDENTTHCDFCEYDDDFSDIPGTPSELNGGSDNTPSTPMPGTDTGVSNLLIAAISGEWETIQQYNDIIATLESEGKTDIIQIIKDIAAEENTHIGQLQKALETISPNVENIAKGEKEAFYDIE